MKFDHSKNTLTEACGITDGDIDSLNELFNSSLEKANKKSELVEHIARGLQNDENTLVAFCVYFLLLQAVINKLGDDIPFDVLDVTKH